MKKTIFLLSVFALISCKSYQVTCYEGIADTNNDIIVPIKKWKWKIKSKQRKFERHDIDFDIVSWDSEYIYYTIPCDSYDKVLNRWEAKRTARWNSDVEINLFD